MNIKRYLRVWLLTTSSASQIAFVSRFGAFLFIVAKVLRFAFFLVFLLILQSKTKSIGGYSLWQIIFFFATFNLVDNLAQFFLREVYRFRSYVISGNFDYYLTKPISPLFRSLFGGSDILDIPMLILSVVFIAFSAFKIGDISIIGVISYTVLILNGFLIALAFHIITLAVGVLTTEVDNTIMLYRDLTQMGRIPTDIYRKPLNWILTFVIPVAVMITIPAKAMMGLLTWPWIIMSFLIGFAFLALSLKFWQYALKNYTSIST